MLLLDVSYTPADRDGAAGSSQLSDWAWPVKFRTIVLVAFLVMLVSYQSLVRYSVLGAVLNGRRRKQTNDDAPIGTPEPPRIKG